MKANFVIIRYILIIGILVSFSQCSSYKNLDKENLSQLYSLDNTLTARYKINNIDSITTIVYYQFNLAEFLYLPNQDSSKFYARYRLKYQLFPDIKASEILDSSSVIFVDSNNYMKNNSSLGYFELEVENHKTYILRLELFDLNSKAEIINLIEIDKTNELNRQNFILLAPDDLPVMNSSVSKDKEYKLVYNNINTNKLHVRYFKSFLKLPQPPSSDNIVKKVIKINADSAFTVSLTKGISEPLIFDKQGIYHFMADSTSSVGYSVFVFTEGYPWISTPMQMIAPLRYITSNPEYNNLLKNEDKKEAVDNFWLGLSSNSERAKAMISIYYNRVQEANMLFASDREGWLTDRGMIFIVYGPPDKVFKNSYLETWTYGVPGNRNSVNFNFYKSQSPFTDNDFRVDRSQTYSNSWNSTVEFWRR